MYITWIWLVKKLVDEILQIYNLSVNNEWANVLFNIYDYMQFLIHKSNKPHKQLIFFKFT